MLVLSGNCRTRGMVVLAVDRAGKITPALHAKTILLPGDRLICYGKIESIKSIADERTSDIAEDDSQVNLQV